MTARPSLTAPSLICVSVQLLPSTAATADCYIFSSVVQLNATPTDLYLSLLSPQRAYHTQLPLPAGLSTAALKDALRQPGEAGSSSSSSSTTAYHFQLLEDKAAAAEAGHSTADAILYVRKDRRDRRAWLTVPLPRSDSHRSERLLQDLQKLYQRLQESIDQHEASSADRAASIQHKLAQLQQKVRDKQSVDDGMLQCTMLLLQEKRDELARCEAEYSAALSRRREARRQKVRREREERREPHSAVLVGGADEETDSDGQTTSEEDEAESELSRLNEEMEDDSAAVNGAVMTDDDSEWRQQQQQQRQDDAEHSTASSLQQNASALAQHDTSSPSLPHVTHRSCRVCCCVNVQCSARQLESVLSSSTHPTTATAAHSTVRAESPQSLSSPSSFFSGASDVTLFASAAASAIIQPKATPPAVAPKSDLHCRVWTKPAPCTLTL